MSFIRSKTALALASILVSLILSGCVYYNTFYNAKRAFNDAEKSRKSSQYSKTRVNTSQYNVAIEKSLKVVENYPNSKYFDDALYVLGVSYYYTEKYAKAERRFREILANYPKSKYVPESKVYLAKTRLKLLDESGAMDEFQAVFNSKTHREFKSEAAMALGTYHYDNKDYKLALPYFLAVRDSLGTNDEKKIAQRFLADSYFELYRFSDAQSAYLQILGMKPSNDDKYHALFQAASSAFRLMKIKQGIDYLTTLMDDQIYYDSLSVLKLKVAEGHEYNEDIDQAEDIYRDVGETATNKKYACEAYYKLGLIYQFDRDKLEEAKKYYDKAVDASRSSDYGQDALQRSSDIGKLATFARTAKIDSTSTQDVIDEAGETQYQLAELYWFSLNKPDTAMLEMQYVIDSFPNSNIAPKAMIALSQMYRDNNSDTTAADSILHLAYERYPHSDYAGQLIDLLGLKGTPADTGYAKVYLDKAENYVIADTLPDSARYYYQYVMDHYPDSKYYLQAKFSQIWLTENYLSPGDSSVVMAYTDFIDSFPQSPWADEARKRLSGTPRRPQHQQQDTTNASQGQQLAQNGDEGAVEGDSTQTGDSTTYVDPLKALYIGPNGDSIKDMPLQPIQTLDSFIYPTEAYRSGWEGDLYFQIFLDFSGEVVDHILKIRSNNDAINEEASKAVASMTFDPLRIPPELQGQWFVYRFRVILPEHLR